MLIDLTLKVNLKNATSKMASLGHYGTHIDVMDNTEIPVEKFITTGKLIDITSIRDRIVDLEDILNKVSVNENDFVIFRSNWLPDHRVAILDNKQCYPLFYVCPKLKQIVTLYL